MTTTSADLWDHLGYFEALAVLSDESAVELLPRQSREARSGAEERGRRVYEWVVEEVVLEAELVVREDVLRKMVSAIANDGVRMEAWARESGLREKVLSSEQRRPFVYTKEVGDDGCLATAGGVAWQALGERETQGALRELLLRKSAENVTGGVVEMDADEEREIEIIMALRSPEGVLEKEDIYWGLLISGVTQVATAMRYTLSYSCEEQKQHGVRLYVGRLEVDQHIEATVVSRDKKRVKGYMYEALLEARQWYWATPER
ncbi:hypothetical protein BDZ89DRAFT_1138465 [Hymenopellis radicata]|nr:hypothetical protein BDZ89DRAFT_1138465 [Hymenopellis radicata]